MPFNRKPFLVEKDHPGVDSKLKKDHPDAFCFRVDRLRRCFPVFYVPGLPRAEIRALLRKAGHGYKARMAAARRAQQLAAGLPA